ncbi:endo-1,4-beta-xylanase [Litoribacter alkaliphilus]|uniref:Beta-xylanase n=1 Tax=Litoribacter ruber TaxID=702568 RepID=A0AAP2G372_9BACT|nr:endo-1,4-beta-xylanase [Litoribacter alkaliphilus]MBS9522741.1 endo-1,4-beta-xylanase [Litoribacter alkaliphilus]
MKITNWSHYKSYISLFIILIIGLGCVIKPDKKVNTTLKDAFEGKFYIGAALSGRHISGRDKPGMEVLKNHFNSIVAENVMKSGMIQAREGEFNFDMADKFIEIGKKNNLHIVGHTLIWHSQAPKWFFTDDEGNDVSPEVLAKRMETHIHTVVGRYKGQVKGWDVVNEAILDDGSWRKSKFYEILGEDFMKLAFQYAHEADPDAELYYNDFSMAQPGKREGVVKMVKNLQDQGVKIDGIGMQGHIGLEYPTIEEFEKSILAFSDLGVTVMITELDLSVLPSPRRDMGADVATNVEYQQSLNPYTEGLPEDVQKKFDERYLSFFKLFLDHQDKISRVTLWGINDGDSWKNGWPVRGRTDYPLLFNRDNTPKSVVNEIIQLAAQY